MQINNNLSSGEKQSTNPKPPHMFRKTSDVPKVLNDELDSQVNKNMAKISKSFRSDQNVLSLENDKSLVVSTNKLIDINLHDSTKSLYNYFEELRNLIDPKIDEIVINNDLDEAIIEEVFEEEINIEEIIKDSEKLIFNTNDKKTLLKDLIDDVSNHSEVNLAYDDAKFNQNIKEMLKEASEEKDNQGTILIEASEPIIDNVQNIKRGKLPTFLVMTILLLLFIGLYLYKDFIISFITK